MAGTFLPRVATIVSFQQLEDSAGEAAAVASQEPVSRCEGVKIPMYYYAAKAEPKASIPRTQSLPNVPDVDNISGSCASDSSGTEDDAASLGLGQDLQASCPQPRQQQQQQLVPVIETELTQESVLDMVLTALWEDCAERGLFRYDVTACSTKVVPGVYGFIAQLNEGRATQKRPTEFRVDKVCQPFDPAKFNFTKAYMREVLIQFEPSPASGASRLVESATASSSPNMVFINVSPIEYGHVLLVPRVNDCIPQLVDPSTVLLALHFALEASNPYFRVGYNSLGAYATINHLHFQAYYLAAPFACERAPTIPLGCPHKRKRGGVRISRMSDYPVNGFVIEADGCLEEVAHVVGQACLNLQAANIPHNLLICDSGSRVFLWPQCYAERQAAKLVPEELLDTGVNPAVFEIAGHVVLKRAVDYADISQEMVWRMLDQVSLPEDRFMEAAHICFGQL